MTPAGTVLIGWVHEGGTIRGRLFKTDGSLVVNDNMILGNEAYADAANPTIAYATNDGGVFGDVATSLFAFKGQLPSVLEE